MMNVNAEASEPMADETGPKPETKAPRRRRKSVEAVTSADAGGEAPAKRTRRARKVQPDAAEAAPAKPARKKRAPRAASGPEAATPAPAKRGTRRRQAVAAQAQLPLAPDAADAAPVADAAEPVDVPAAVGKARTRREAFKLTEGDLAAIGHLEARAETLGRQAGKSTLVRAAIRALAALDDAGLAAALDAPVPALLAVVGGKRRKSH